MKGKMIQALAFNHQKRAELNARCEKMEDNILEIRKRYSDYLRKSLSQSDIYQKKETTQEIILAGGTGYLGMNLIEAFLEAGVQKIKIVSRHADREQFQESYSTFVGEKRFEEWKEKIELFTGDVSKPNLAMQKDSYDELCKNTDCIINAAVDMDCFGSYPTLYQTNVEGTHNLLNLQNDCGKEVAFYQISTVGISEGEEPGKQYSFLSEEESCIERCYESVFMNKAYYRTKLEAENLVCQAQVQGKKAYIIRIGNIGFHSQNGTYCVNGKVSSIMNLLNSFLDIGILPNDTARIIDFSFADEVAKSIVLLVSNNTDCHIYHCLNPRVYSFQDLFRCFSQCIPIECCEANAIPDILCSKIEEGYEDKIQETLLNFIKYRNLETTKTIIAAEKTEHLLRQFGFSWSSLDASKVKQYLLAREKQ